MNDAQNIAKSSFYFFIDKNFVLFSHSESPFGMTLFGAILLFDPRELNKQDTDKDITITILLWSDLRLLDISQDRKYT